MRRHKAVARIFLFLSIVSFAFAGFAPQQTPPMHEMRVDLVTGAEDVTGAGHTRSGELPELLGRPSTAGHLQSRIDLIPAASFKQGSIDLDDPENKKFFSKELNRKMNEYFILGTIAGVVTGIANGIQKQYLGTISPGAYVFFICYYYLSSLLPPSSQRLNGRRGIRKTYFLTISQFDDR
jgi:hypothetical protein